MFLYRINRLRPPKTRVRSQAYKLLSRSLERRWQLVCLSIICIGIGLQVFARKPDQGSRVMGSEKAIYMELGLSRLGCGIRYWSPSLSNSFRYGDTKAILRVTFVRDQMKKNLPPLRFELRIFSSHTSETLYP
jgi:hypothetical protein